MAISIYFDLCLEIFLILPELPISPPDTGMLSSSTPSNRNRMSWFATESDKGPEQSLADDIAPYLQDIAEYRWCMLPDGTYMFFWYWPKGKTEKNWTTQCLQMGHKVSTWNQTANQQKTRTKVLWTMFAGSNISFQEQLRKNVHVLVPRTPQTKKIEKENQPPISTTPASRLDFSQELSALVKIPERHPIHLTEIEKMIKHFFQQPDSCNDQHVLTLIATMTGKKLKHIYSCITFPCHSTELSFPHLSTLELHRRVIVLESVASGLLHLFKKVRLELMETSLSSSDQQDLVFLDTCVQEHGEGKRFWQLHDDTQDTQLAKICHWMTANRETAFDRLYLIIDVKTWAFPVISELLLAMHKSEKNRHQVWVTLEQMLKIRQNIKNQESSYLLRYGSYLTMYCKNLFKLLMKIQSEAIPAYLHIAGASGGTGVLTIEGDFHSHMLANSVDLQNVVKRRLAEVYYFPFVFGFA